MYQQNETLDLFEKYEGQWLVDYPFFMMENKNV